MNAVILAAGVGRRLGPFSQELPKCLLAFGGKTLLARHLEMLDLPLSDGIFVVVGHCAGAIEAEIARVECAAPVHVIHNSEYRLGSARSLLCAEAAYRHSPSLIMDADILFGRVLLQRLLAAPAPDCLILDDDFNDTGEEVKVVAEHAGRVSGLGKSVGNRQHVVGESLGIYRFAARTGQLLASRLRTAVEDDPDVEYETVINDLLKDVDVRYVTVAALPWIEIDFPSDVSRANEHVYPALLRLDPY